MVWSGKQGQVSPTQQILHGLQNSWIVELRLSPNSVAKLYPLPLCFEVNTSSRYALNALGPCLDVQFYFCHEILPPFEGEIAWGRLSDSKLLKIASRRERISCHHRHHKWWRGAQMHTWQLDLFLPRQTVCRHIFGPRYWSSDVALHKGCRWILCLMKEQLIRYFTQKSTYHPPYREKLILSQLTQKWAFTIYSTSSSIPLRKEAKGVSCRAF